MPEYPRLPEPPGAAPNEPSFVYGARVLCWLLNGGTTATCTEQDLLRADAAAVTALAAHDGPDAHADDRAKVSPRALDTINARRHDIARALRVIREPRQQTQAPVGHHDQRPPVGPMAPLRPAPVTEPPAGDYADAAPIIRF